MIDGGTFRVLIVDDEPNIREGLARAFAGEPYKVETADDAGAALAACRRDRHDLVITDLKLPGPPSGLDLVRAIQHERPEARIIVVTAYGSIRSAVEAMRLGAHDFLAKPVDLDLLRAHVRDAYERHRLREENRALRERLAAAGELPELVGQGAAFRELAAGIRRVADADVAVLIVGESGTGKELVARAIHALGPRRDGPFVATNVGALPESLTESELFGYERGAFTGARRRKPGCFELARGGTLLLDELDEAPVRVQVDLLRVLERREVRRVGGEEVVPLDLRIVVTVQRDPEELVAAGVLRKDLYYRLNVVPLRVPPLRERRDDVPLLAQHFLRLAGRRHRPDAEPKQLAGAALRRLCDYSWPGNVRQLRNLMERLVLTVEGPVIHADDLPHVVRDEPPSPDVTTLDQAVQEAEKRAILAALGRCNYHRERTAALLGVSVRTLHYKLNRYGLQ